jgi:deoxyribose-phosphate aldolase
MNIPIDWNTDLHASAARALQCLDLTSLNDTDTEADIARLCARAQGPHGNVAAVCVWPRLAAFARSQLPTSVAVAAVANFPDGSTDTARAVRDTQEIVQAGAQEVDVVLPWRQLLSGDPTGPALLLQAVRKASEGLRLKVILETGELRTDAAIAQASRIALDGGADFLKTSTGKTVTSATPQAAHRMLTSIAQDPKLREVTGFKPSGGIRTVADAATYLWITQEILGPQALTPQRFRIGASSVLADIEAVLSGTAAASPATPGSY